MSGASLPPCPSGLLDSSIIPALTPDIFFCPSGYASFPGWRVLPLHINSTSLCSLCVRPTLVLDSVCLHSGDCEHMPCPWDGFGPWPFGYQPSLLGGQSKFCRCVLNKNFFSQPHVSFPCKAIPLLDRACMWSHMWGPYWFGCTGCIPCLLCCGGALGHRPGSLGAWSI